MLPPAALAWATKGLEPYTGRFLHEVARERFGTRPLAVVSGPNFAREVARGLPTATTVASRDPDWAASEGAHPPADLYRYVGLITPDGEYYVSIDMESMLHPQTLLAVGMNGEPLSTENGAPLVITNRSAGSSRPPARTAST